MGKNRRGILSIIDHKNLPTLLELGFFLLVGWAKNPLACRIGKNSWVILSIIDHKNLPTLTLIELGFFLLVGWAKIVG
ncbi:hypothetical protein LYNGBM3L_50850 [Moorena producens 3L]|uniref:Uncharacterized protein n=1 Tax=Moorena producens 3L TaxID=489825 RepID=F4XYK3_9CYAN|nr:hypothetical protein LYNGBM3L_50850 [Moorena producens 3L]OLT67580.1 hypothetical protein BI334_23390 [Moorena producens 3L]